MRVVPFCFFALLVSCTQVEPQRDDVRKHIEQKIAKSQQAWAVEDVDAIIRHEHSNICLLYTSPSPRDATLSRMPSSA